MLKSTILDLLNNIILNGILVLQNIYHKVVVVCLLAARCRLSSSFCPSLSSCLLSRRVASSSGCRRASRRRRGLLRWSGLLGSAAGGSVVVVVVPPPPPWGPRAALSASPLFHRTIFRSPFLARRALQCDMICFTVLDTPHTVRAVFTVSLYICRSCVSFLVATRTRSFFV